MSDPLPTEDLTDLYENAPCGYLSLSPDARIVKVNRTLIDWLGRPAEALLGHSVHELLSFGGRIAYETHLAPLLRLQGFVHEIAFDLLDAEGAAIPVIANAAERRDADGRHLFTRLTLFKAVDRRTYERSLIEAKIKAETEARMEHDSSVLREQFIAVLGHDLRTPLTSLSIGASMLGKAEALSELGQKIVREMQASASRGLTLIDNVLDFARGRLGAGLALTLEADEPLAPVLEQIIAEQRMIAPARTIATDIAITESVHCDRSRVGQLLQNLLANALTHGAADSPIRIAATTAGGKFVLTVANEGDPIPESAREQLFRPFFRGVVQRSQNGLGLGLFIVHEIAKAHGGEIEVASDAAETRFTFQMPLRPARAIPPR